MIPALSIGQVVADRFRIEEVIGEGGMGTIYRAQHVKLPRTFALKVLKPNLAADGAFVKRFLREAVAASQVVHPNVVNVTDYGQLPDGNYYIAMEHLEGRTLDDELERLGYVPLTKALDILIQLADALNDCHTQGIVHRDLKTENVLLCDVRGQRDVVKLVDFGIARILGPDWADWQVTQGGMIFGTPEYLSPERALDKDIDGRSDIYALGIIAYELVVGEPPFMGRYTQLLKAHITQAPPPPSKRAHEPLPPAYDALVLKCLAKEPDHRYATCGDLVQELVRLRGSLAGRATEATGRAERASGPGRQVATDGAWGAVRVRPPTGSAPLAPPQAVDRQRLGEAIHQALAADEIRLQLEDTQKELAYSLSTLAPADAGWLDDLNELLRLEQEAQRTRSELLLLAQQHQELREQTEGYARVLRRLLLEVGDTPAAEGGPRERLQGYLDQLLQGSHERATAIEQEQERLRVERKHHESAIAASYASLRSRLEAHRSGARDRARNLFERMDSLQRQLDQIRAHLP